ncbi:MAG: glycosyltransferase, partial [Candidatus Latescibacteria bacterium]|nr:glycosyltransferase [Candidatus Latescibacterota bacterium]
ELMRLDLQLVILGTGMKEYHDLLAQAAAKHPEKVGVKLAFDNRIAHLIEAGADMFLMPSRYEPCGLNQLYSLRYGTLPVVRETGGLADTIQDDDPATHQGTGFRFKEYTPEALLGAVRRALDAYHNPPVWQAMMRRAMTADFSWGSSAKKYAALYEKAVEKRRGSGFGIRG